MGKLFPDLYSVGNMCCYFRTDVMIERFLIKYAHMLLSPACSTNSTMESQMWELVIPPVPVDGKMALLEVNADD